MFTPAHTPSFPPVPPARPIMRSHPAPVIHDRWGDDAPARTPATAPLVVTQMLAAVGESATLVPMECGAVAVQLAGRWRGRVRFETSDDGATWRPLTLAAHGTGARTISATRPGLWHTSGDTTGRHMRLHVVALTAGAVVGCLAAAPPPTVPERPPVSPRRDHLTKHGEATIGAFVR